MMMMMMIVYAVTDVGFVFQLCVDPAGLSRYGLLHAHDEDHQTSTPEGLCFQISASLLSQLPLSWKNHKNLGNSEHFGETSRN